jgi:primosomal protein N' (replication factor Y)
VNPAARVVPDIASFSVDDGFWYSIPDHLVEDLRIGSIVRVPLSGRRVRGWVVEMATSRDGNLKEVAGVSGSGPVFDEELLKSLVWCARHYVAPVSTLLGRATPPNLPRSTPPAGHLPEVDAGQHPIRSLAEKTASGTRAPVTALVGNWHRRDWLADLGSVLAAGRTVLIVAASAAEVRVIRDVAGRVWGSETVVGAHGEDDKSDTDAWQTAQSPPRVVVGTPKTAAWQIADIGLAVALEEGRRAMKDRQTPTIHVRELLRNRSRIEGFNLVFYGPTPSVETLSAGADVIHQGNRAWPLVEVVDRLEDQPGAGYLSDRAAAAIGATVGHGGRVFVFTHRRAAYASMRCARCRTLRSCPSCGSRVGRVERCPRCEAAIGPCVNCGGTEFEEMGTIPERLVSEINRKVGRGSAVAHPGDETVTVGTERDLAGLAPVDLAIAADVDGMLMGVGYRTSEEALRQLARLALAVKEGHGTRLMLQTARPESLLVKTMRRGDPIPYLERVLVERAREGSPPATEMIAVEIRGDVPDTAASDLASLEGAAIMGPMEVESGQRWLLTGHLGHARLDLRKLAGRWRDAGATVRIDVDPIDL